MDVEVHQNEIEHATQRQIPYQYEMSRENALLIQPPLPTTTTTPDQGLNRPHHHHRRRRTRIWTQAT